MAIQVCYFSNEVNMQSLLCALSLTYNVDEYKIKKLSEFDENSLLNYSLTKYNGNKGFCTQLEIFISKNGVIESKIYNNLILGLKLNSILKIDILINDESDDPYQWLLIKDNRLFLVEETFSEKMGECISINNMRELDIKKALTLLPNRIHIFNDAQETFFVKHANTWLYISI